MQFSFRKPHFWHPQNFAKTLFWHNVTLFVFSKIPQKHYKNGEKQWTKNLDQFLTLDLDQFLTLETPNLGPVFNSTAVKLLTGSRLAILIVTNWATSIVTNWATSFSHYKTMGFRWFFWCSVISLCSFFVSSYLSVF